MSFAVGRDKPHHDLRTREWLDRASEHRGLLEGLRAGFYFDASR